MDKDGSPSAMLSLGVYRDGLSVHAVNCIIRTSPSKQFGESYSREAVLGGRLGRKENASLDGRDHSRL